MEELLKHIGKAKYDEYGTGIIWGGSDEDLNHLLDIDVRGWGTIQNYFRQKGEAISFESAEKFQDAVGKFIVDAINEKVEREKL